jgi:hypothetical protein
LAIPMPTPGTYSWRGRWVRLDCNIRIRTRTDLTVLTIVYSSHIFHQSIE